MLKAFIPSCFFMIHYTASIATLLGLAGLSPAWGISGTTNHVWHAVGSSAAYIRGAPAFGDDGTIYAGSGDNNLYAFNPDGTTNHVWNAGADIIGSPAIGTNGTIYIATCSPTNRVWAFNPDGTTNGYWQLPYSVYGTPAIGADGTIYIGDLGHKFYALNPSDFSTSHVWSAGGDFRGHAAIASDGTIYVGNDDHKLYAYNPDGTTNHAWMMNGQIYHGPAISSNGTIYIGDQAGYFWAFNPDGTTGNVCKLSDMVYHSSAAIGADGTIFVGAFSTTSNKSYCYALNPDFTLKMAWELGTRYSMNSPVIGANGSVFISSEYTLFGLNPTTGATNISWYLGDDMMGGVAIGPDKNIYVGSEHGSFFSLRGILPMANTYWPKQHQNLKNTGLVFYAPKNVTASDGAYVNRVVIAWDAVPQATGYQIYRSATSSSPAVIGNSQLNNYADMSATPGATYYYWVQATNSVFTSPLSDPCTGSRAVVILPPRAPVNVRASDGTYTNKILVTWASVTNASAYDVMRSLLNSTGTASRVGSAISASYNDYSAGIGTTYYYWVRSINDGGTGRLSSSDSGLRAAEIALPSEPQNLKASDGAYTNKVALTWTAVSNAVSYKVYRNTSNTSASSAWLCDAASPAAEDASVTVGTVYYYWVSAINPAGMGNYSASDSGFATASLTAPSAPTMVAATKGAYSDRVRVTWSAVSNASSYEVYRNTANDPASSAKLETEPTSTSFDDSTIAVDTTFYYWVKAKNEAGTSGFSSSDSGYAASTITAPSAPSWITATKGTYSDRVRVTWSAVSSASAYEIYRSTANDPASAVKLNPDSTMSPFDDTTVTTSVPYYYWLKAKNESGSSGFSACDMGYASSSGADTRWLPAVADFDGDALADPAVFQATTGKWRVKLSSAGYYLFTTDAGFLGTTNNTGLAADLDGDAKADPAAYDAATGYWSVRLTTAGYYRLNNVIMFGGPAFAPLAADLDGDAKADPAVYLPAALSAQPMQAGETSTADWVIKLSSAGYNEIPLANFMGGSGWTALAADFDGDAKADPAVYQTSSGIWVVKLSTVNYALEAAISFGSATYVTAAGDFDGDRLADPAIYNPVNGDWSVKLSGSGYLQVDLLGFLGGME